MIHYTTIDIEHNFFLEDVQCAFQVNTTTYSDNAYYGYAPERTDVDSVELLWWMVGGLRLNRYQLIEATDKEFVERMEDVLAEELAEKFNSGELEAA